MKLTFEAPEVQDLLSGVFRCSSQTYYRVDPETGKHFICPIRRHLIGLGMCSKTASLYLKRANLPITPFVRDETAAVREKPPSKRRGPPVSNEEREAKRAKAEAAQDSKRYQLIVSASRKSGAEPKPGIWDEVAGRVIELFTSHGDALDALIQLKTGNS